MFLHGQGREWGKVVRELVSLHSWVNHFIRVCENPRIIYSLIARTKYSTKSYFCVSLNQILLNGVHDYMAILSSSKQNFDCMTLVWKFWNCAWQWVVSVFGREMYPTNYLDRPPDITNIIILINNLNYAIVLKF